MLGARLGLESSSKTMLSKPRSVLVWPFKAEPLVQRGVYLLLHYGCVVYVGKSISLGARARSHGNKRHDDVWVVWEPVDADRAWLDDVETALIGYFEPKYNLGNGRGSVDAGADRLGCDDSFRAKARAGWERLDVAVRQRTAETRRNTRRVVVEEQTGVKPCGPLPAVEQMQKIEGSYIERLRTRRKQVEGSEHGQAVRETTGEGVQDR